MTQNMDHATRTLDDVHAAIKRLQHRQASQISHADRTELLKSVIPHLSAQGSHWFCRKVSMQIREIAGYSILFHGYKNQERTIWENHLFSILSDCSQCVKCYHETKLEVMRLYVADSIQGKFEAFIHKWEVDFLLSREWNNNHVMLVWMDGSLSSDPRLKAKLENSSPPSVMLPGLLLAFQNKERSDHQIAYEFGRNCKFSMLSEDDAPVWEAILRVTADEIGSSGINFDAWDTLSFILCIADEKFAKDININTLMTLNIIPSILAHLSDRNDNWITVLRCFSHSLRCMGSGIWVVAKDSLTDPSKSLSPDYPQVCADAILDHPYLTTLLSSDDTVPNSHRLTTPLTGDLNWLEWLPLYIRSVRKTSVIRDALSKSAVKCMEELQQSRFNESCKANAWDCMMTILEGILGKDELQEHIIWILDIHCASFIKFSLDKRYRCEPVFKPLKSRAWIWLRRLLNYDASRVCNFLHDFGYYYCSVQRKRKEIAKKHKLQTSQGLPRSKLFVPTFEDQSFPSFEICQSLWSQVHQLLQSQAAMPDFDVRDLLLILPALSTICHITPLTESVWLARRVASSQNTATRFNKLLESFNVVLASMLEPLPKLLALPYSGSALKVITTEPKFAFALTTFIFSPIDDINATAQSVLESGWNVLGREECFQESLKTGTRNIQTVINVFVQYIEIVPEAAELTTRLVKCLSDVIEALCDESDGLWSSENPSTDQSVVIWKSLTGVLSLIYRKAQHWSEFHANSKMLVWMRDAIILGRDLLRSIHVFAGCASKPNQVTADSFKQFETMKMMLTSMDVSILSLTSWFALSDSELLHQTCELIFSALDLHKRHNVDPDTALIETLERFILRPKSNSSILNEAQLSQLEESISPWQEVKVIKASCSTNQPEGQFGRSQALQLSHVDASQYPKTSTMNKSHPIFDKKSAVKPPDANIASSSTKVAPVIDMQARREAYKRERETREQLEKVLVVPKVQSGATSAILRKPLPFVDKATKPNLTAESKSALPSILFLDEKFRANLISNSKSAIQKPAKLPPDEKQITKMRLNPSTAQLYREILHWDYMSEENALPSTLANIQPVEVKDSYKDWSTYFNTMFPLILMEAWSGIKEARSELAKRDQIAALITDSGTIDEWRDLKIKVTEPPHDWWVTDTDLVLMQRGDDWILGKVSSQNKTVKNFVTNVQLTVRCRASAERQHQVSMAASIGSEWRVTKFYNMNTVQREFCALMSSRYIDLITTILSPRPIQKKRISVDQKETAMKSYGLNSPQAEAVLGAMQSIGFSLIQGPPGTGKTKTICGLAGAFLSSRGKPIRIPGQPVDSTPESFSQRSKLLVCAPSNAAIDEVVKRLMTGLKNEYGLSIKPNIVRVGQEHTINIAVKPLSIDELIDQRVMATTVSSSTSQLQMSDLRSQLAQAKAAIELLQDQIGNCVDYEERSQLLGLVAKTTSERNTLSQSLEKVKETQTSARRAQEAARRKARLEVFAAADIVCCTLSGAGQGDLNMLPPFDTVIIDEAAQAVESSSLIPLKYGCKRCILVGDPNQLPPTVLSQKAQELNYSQSLFVRLMNAGGSGGVYLLSIQYRMHPEISVLPSRLFYNNQLKDGPGMAAATEEVWHQNPNLGPYRFFDVSHGVEERGSNSHSLSNKAEAMMVLELYKYLLSQYKSVFDFNFNVGIVTMYKEQKKLLQRTFRNELGQEISDLVDFNTVDGFQGQEKAIIICSCVRSGVNAQFIGFLGDKRRMNVAFTRAKSGLFIIGNASTLSQADTMWKSLVDDASHRGLLVRDIRPGFLRSAPPLVTQSSITSNPGSSRGSQVKSPKSRQGSQTKIVRQNSSKKLTIPDNELISSIQHPVNSLIPLRSPDKQIMTNNTLPVNNKQNANSTIGGASLANRGKVISSAARNLVNAAASLTPSHSATKIRKRNSIEEGLSQNSHVHEAQPSAEWKAVKKGKFDIADT